jgi:MGT family glycosyltransferase
LHFFTKTGNHLLARILVASVPLSGHVNPGIALTKTLIDRGHEVCWYGSRYFKSSIEATGARFSPITEATDFDEKNLQASFPGVKQGNLLRHSTTYMKKVFFDQMPGQYHDLQKILEDFKADIIITDEWFTGAIPLAEQKVLPWVVYSSSPLMLMDRNVPAPGPGLFPDSSIYGFFRNAIVNFMTKQLIFAPMRCYVNRIRKGLSLGRMKHFFLENNFHISSLYLKFNTPAFDFHWKKLPESIHYAGPVLPGEEEHSTAEMPQFPDNNKPLILITQGSVDTKDQTKLIIPALRALSEMDVNVVVSTGGQDAADLKQLFPSENYRFFTYIPYATVMPHVSIAITNGGFGGVATALSFGVPVIIAGDTEDKPVVASRVQYNHCGINLKTGKPSAKQIAKAVTKILTSPKYRANAERIRADYAKHDALQESAALIEALIRKVN